MILHGDNRIVLNGLPESSVELAYLDPPFNTGKDFGAWQDVHDGYAHEAAHWPVEARSVFEVLASRWSERLVGYLVELGETFLALRRVVKPSGAIWIHVDERHAHHVRLVAESLLTPAMWQRTVIWRYRRWPTKARGHQRMHDVLFWFAGPEHTFHELYGYESIAESTLKTFGTAKQRAAFDDLGNRVSIRTEEVTKGPPLSDVWDIGVIAPRGLERCRGGKWPTQKPEALLERVILSTSNEGDTVLDPCCGSGTTLAVAQKFGRKWIGIDQSADACRIATSRLASLQR
jgi:site-specific DNA-methyltransferase (adenine-specific)